MWTNGDSLIVLAGLVGVFGPVLMWCRRTSGEGASDPVQVSIRDNTQRIVQQYLATSRGQVVSAALEDPEMRQVCYEELRDHACRQYPLNFPVESRAWSTDLHRQVAMYVREMVDQWE